MIKVVKFKKLKGSNKKYEITFEKNGKQYIRKFGASGMSDFTIHKDRERRERYITRHKKDLGSNDPMKPGYLSMYILWNKPSLSASLADYKRRLNVYNRTGKFPKGISGSKKLSFGAIIPFQKPKTTSAFGKKYDVPDNVINKTLYASIKAKIKRSIKGRRWGAYDSGRLVREYKAAGGGYAGNKGKTNLSRWYKEKWVDACAWPKRKPCGRKTKSSIAYCRPSKRVDSKTPKLVQDLTKAQIKSRCAKKKRSPMKIITKFGNKQELVDKMRQQMFNEIMSYKDTNEGIRNVITKRCKRGFADSFCQSIFTELLLSLYFTIVSKSKITQSRNKNLLEMNSFIPSGFKPTKVTVNKNQFEKVNEMLYSLQDHTYGTFKNARVASLIYEYINLKN